MKIFVSVLSGAIIGFLIGYFGRCSAGTCPLTSNPLLSASIGAMIGFMVAAK